MRRPIDKAGVRAIQKHIFAPPSVAISMTDRSLRPMTLGDIFDEGFDLYKKNLPLLLLVVAVVAVPVKIVDAILAMRYLSDAQGMFNSVFGNGDNSGFFFWLGDFARKASFPQLCFYLANAVALCALIQAASQRYLGKSVTLGQAYRGPLWRLPSLFGGALLYLVGITAGFMACIILVVWPLIVWLFSAHAFTLESKGAVASLKRSVALVANNGGRVFLALLLLAVLSFIIQVGFAYTVAYAFEILLKLTPQTQDYLSSVLVGGLSWRDRVAGEVANALSMLLLVPFVVCVLTVFYYDLRVRKEAFDVELLASDLGYPPLSELDGYLPPAMVFSTSGLPFQSNPPYAAPPLYGAPPVTGYGQPPQYGAPPPGYGQPSQYVGPPPGYGQPPQYGVPPPVYGQPAQYGVTPPTSGWPQTEAPAKPAPASPATETPPQSDYGMPEQPGGGA